MQRDHKSLALSIILHVALVLFIFKAENGDIKEPPTSPIEITVTGKEPEKPKEIKQESNYNIIPKSDLGKNTIKSDKGYYGIGIGTLDYAINGRFMVEITSVAYGYPADLAGLQIGDKIIEVDEVPIVDGNEIRSTGPTPLTLKVIKNDGTVIFIRLTREFIRTEH